MPEASPFDEFNSDPLFSTMREEESLFARGEDDALVRYVKPTLKQFEQKVTLIIDGELVEVPKAKPKTDALGNLMKGPDGKFIPLATTIYDAALQLVRDKKITQADLLGRIPVLCHQQHLNPVAVCRMCSVHISSIKRGKFTPGRKLVPACQHRVEDKMAVLSRLGPRDVPQFLKRLNEDFKIDVRDLPKERSVEEFTKLVQDSTRFLSDLLVADHLPAGAKSDDRYRNELATVSELVGISIDRCSKNPGGSEGRNSIVHAQSRPIPANAPALPYSSRSIRVDHDRCILCDRCARSCSDVKPFKIIGHTGKGYRSRISFDLDQIMNQSGCVQCGECMTSCPTGALTLNRRVSPKSWPDNPTIPEDPDQPLPAGFLTAAEMQDVELLYEEGGRQDSFFPFAGIPYSYLRWNEGAVRRRVLKPGDVLCPQGEYGSTAFLLVEGEFQGTRDEGLANEPEEAASGFWNWLRGKGSRATAVGERRQFPLSAHRDLILGEIACITNDKRTATITATTPAVVLEVMRNMLGMLQRNPAARRVLDTIYRRRAISNCLNSSDLFQGLSGEERRRVIAEFEKDAEVIRVEPGEVIVAEGDRVGFDENREFHGDLYIILLGFVKVSQRHGNQERVVASLKKDQYFGEIALLPDHPLVGEARQEFGINPFQRTATCTALADVEIVRIPGRTFRKIFQPDRQATENDAFAAIAKRIAVRTVERLREQQATLAIERDKLGDFLRQGLYQGQKMLVLDLLSCTRCDECTKACASAHGDNHSRLLREGLRFGDFLVAASCRSCHQPYCLDGCPVDAIHRKGKSLEILIDSHCIGCGLCEKNCPYGSIQMVPAQRGKLWSDILPDADDNPLLTAATPRKSVNCDLCHDLVKPGNDPFCVSACPHKAAFRWSGEKLMSEVSKRE